MKPNPSRIVTAHLNKAACIIAVGKWDGHKALLKNRDRNYVPEVQIVHEIREGVEVAYMEDLITGWCEGINEFGIGVVNSALQVNRDEAEKVVVKTVGKKSKDGPRILKVLECKNLKDALEAAKTYEGGLKGHSIIADKDTTYGVEGTSKHDFHSQKLPENKLYVRTNHGIHYDDSGYVEGPDYDSSVIRRDRAKKFLSRAESVEDVAPILVHNRINGFDHPNNMVRRTKNMSTTSQMVLDLDAKELLFYVLPKQVKFVGVDNRLPKKHKPKIKVRIFKYHGIDRDEPVVKDVTEKHMSKTASSIHDKQISLMKFMSAVARKLGVSEHVYIVGGAVRNFVLNEPIKDLDVVIDSVALKGKDSDWFAKQLQKSIPVRTNLTTNQYGVAIISVQGPWILDGEDLQGEVIEIANARKESYGKTDAGKGYKPDEVSPATIEEDLYRREFTFNTLLLSLASVANGPDRDQILDLTGCGLRDLEAGELRCPSDPDQTFRDDPSRLLRVLKFCAKYGFKITPDTEAAIKRNAPGLKKAPHNAISKLLLETVLPGSKGLWAVKEMDRLGLLEVVADMMNTNKDFRAAIDNWAQNQNVRVMLSMVDLGLPLKSQIGFMTPQQQARFKEIMLTMEDEELQGFLMVLKQPGKVLDFPRMGRELGLSGAAFGLLTNATRDALLAKPTRMYNIEGLKEDVLTRMTMAKMAAKLL